jgi:hypothetical protein
MKVGGTTRKQMEEIERNGDEAAAVERVATAAREVRSASQALDEQFNKSANTSPRLCNWRASLPQVLSFSRREMLSTFCFHGGPAADAEG